MGAAARMRERWGLEAEDPGKLAGTCVWHPTRAAGSVESKPHTCDHVPMTLRQRRRYAAIRASRRRISVLGRALWGSNAAFDDWLTRPAMALNSRRPIELLRTPMGTRVVTRLLVQLEYGVYV